MSCEVSGIAPAARIVVYEINLRFPNRGRRTFFCLSKRKYAKKKTPRLAQTASALLGFGALAQLQHIPVL